MTGDDHRSDDDHRPDAEAFLPPGALSDLGEQLRTAASRRSELLAASTSVTTSGPDRQDRDLSDPDERDPHGDDPRSDDLREADVIGPRATGLTPVTTSSGRVRRAPLAVAAMGIAAALVLIVATFVLSGRDSPPASAGVHVDRAGETVTVRIDGTADPAEVVDALQAAGVVADVEPQATGPSRVGRFVGLSTGAAQDPGTDVTDGSVLTFDTGDQVTLLVGIAAKDGETYDSATDGFAPGEPFEGLDQVVGMTWEEARPILEARAAERGLELQHLGPDTGIVSTVQVVSASLAFVMT